MNRNSEYLVLLKDLQNTPPALEYTLQRAKAKMQRRKRAARFIGIPAGTFLGLLAGFVLMVNLAPGFAYACGRVHGLKELAQAVAWSPSLSAAVENEYVQPVEQTGENNGFRITVQYVIVDSKRLNIYYTLEHDRKPDTAIRVNCDLGGAESGTAGIFTMSGEGRKGIRSITIDFREQVPAELELTLAVCTLSAEGQQAVIAKMPFSLRIDPYFTAQGEHIPVNQEFSLDGQRFSLEFVDIYPTHTRIRVEAHENNTLLLGGAELWLENERGERFETIRNGIRMECDEDGRGMTFLVDSSFFSRSKALTLYITEVRWQDWIPGRVRVDLTAGTAENLQEGTRFLGSQKKADGWYLWFTARTAKTEPAAEDSGLRGIFLNNYWDSLGNRYTSMGRRIYNGLYDPVTGEQTMRNSGRVTELVVLPDYTDTEVWLEPARQKLEKPIRIVIKE